MLFPPPPGGKHAVLCVTTQRHSAHTFPRGKPAAFFPITKIPTSIYAHCWAGKAFRNYQSLQHTAWNPQRWSSTCFDSTSISWLQAVRNQALGKSDFKTAGKSIFRIFFSFHLFCMLQLHFKILVIPFWDLRYFTPLLSPVIPAAPL